MKKRGIPSEKLCLLEEPIWVHYSGVPCREWLAPGSPIPIVAPYTGPTTHIYHSNLQMRP